MNDHFSLSQLDTAEGVRSFAAGLATSDAVSFATEQAIRLATPGYTRPHDVVIRFTDQTAKTFAVWQLDHTLRGILHGDCDDTDTAEEIFELFGVPRSVPGPYPYPGGHPSLSYMMASVVTNLREGADPFDVDATTAFLAASALGYFLDVLEGERGPVVTVPLPPRPSKQPARPHPSVRATQ